MRESIQLGDIPNATVGHEPMSPRSSPLDWLCAIRGLDVLPIGRNEWKPVAVWIREGFAADNAYVYLRESSGFRCVGLSQVNPVDPPMNTVSEAVLQYVFDQHQSVLIDLDTRTGPFVLDPQIQRFNIRCALCVPMKVSGRCIGMIYVDSRSGSGWNDGDAAVLEMAADILALIRDHACLSCSLRQNDQLAQAGLAAQKMSHAVKNILQMVGGAAEVIDFALKTKQLDRLQRGWDILQPNLQRMKKFTLDMLDYSRPSPLEIVPGDLSSLVGSVVESVTNITKDRGITIDLDLDSSRSSVALDPTRIQDMLRNLLINAIDRIGSNPGTITLESSIVSERRSVIISLSDTGPAIKPELAAEVYAPYEPHREQLSTGLGMAIARRIVEQHNGDIHFENISSGVRFTITLPMSTQSC